ncbi:MAG: collagen-like protein [Streptococcus pyogenes]|nr:MAG: collagen-like protein [Streptococcus pyogenes]
MTENIPLRVQFKRMTASKWASSDVILLEGEIGFETDTGFAKFGDGKNQFKNLKYLTGPAGKKGDKGPQGPSGDRGPIGQTGPQGVSVQSASVDSEGYLTVTLDNGQSFKSEISLKGPRGDAGPKGADGKMTFEQLTEEQRETLKGDRGPKGDVGPKGNDGAPGKSITISSIKEETTGGILGSWFSSDAKSTKVTFSDGQSISLPHGKDGELPSDVVRQQQLAAYATKDELRKVDVSGQLSGYVRQADIQSLLNNIGKIKDTKTGQFLDVIVVDKGQVPSDTRGRLVFERA